MDWNKVFGLLHIADKANQWPHLRWVHDAAMKELAAMKPEEEPRAGPRAIPSTQAESANKAADEAGDERRI